jgi:hypothetical protein
MTKRLRLDEALHLQRFVPTKDETPITDGDLLAELKANEEDVQRITDRIQTSRKRKFEELNQAHRLFQERAPPPHRYVLQILAWMAHEDTQGFLVHSKPDEEEELRVSYDNVAAFEALQKALPKRPDVFDAKSPDGWAACIGKLAATLTLRKDKNRDDDDIWYSVVDDPDDRPTLVDLAHLVDRKTQDFQLDEDDASVFVDKLNSNGFADSKAHSVEWTFDDGDHHGSTWEATYRLPLVGVNWTRLQACMEAQLSKEEMADYLAQYEQLTNKFYVPEEEEEEEGEGDEAIG